MKEAIFIISGIVLLGILILLLFLSAKKKRAQMKEFLSAPEPKYKGFDMPRQFNYSNECERIINKKFANFISICNDMMIEGAHKEYLEKRKRAEHYLALDSEADTDKAIAESVRFKEEYREAAERAHWFNYSPKDTSGEITDLFYRFKALSDSLPNSKAPAEPLRSFAPKGKKWIEASGGIWLLLNEFYIMVCNSNDLTIRVCEYSALEVKSDFTVKSLGWGVEPAEGDEIAAKHWKHVTANGRPDKKYQNNPMRVEVYKGFVIINIGKIKAKIDFRNKSDAILTEKKISGYKRAVSAKAIKKYTDYIFSSSVLTFRVAEMDVQMKNALEKMAEEKLLEKERMKEERAAAKLQLKEQKAKERAEFMAEKKADRQVAVAASGIEGGLSKEEIELIMSARRAREKAEQVANSAQENEQKKAKIEALEKAPISQSSGTRVITNNLFFFNYVVDEGFSHNGISLVLADEYGDAVSTEFNIEPIGAGSRFRASFELLPNLDFDSEKSYYMLLTPIGEDEPIGKLEYKIKISFVSDFDF